MRRMLPIYVAAGVSLGVILAYLIAGGASYKPLTTADPCEPRSLEVLAERGVFEGIALSALDGAACELQVTREELTAAFADNAALAAFAEEQGIDAAEIDAAVRAGLIRAVDDAEQTGLIGGAVASLARLLAENAPVPAVVDLFQALPGDPSLVDVLVALGEVGLTAEQLGSDALDRLRQLGDGLIPDDLDKLIPQQLPQIDPGALEGSLPDDIRPPSAEELQQLQDDLGALLP